MHITTFEYDIIHYNINLEYPGHLSNRHLANGYFANIYRGDILPTSKKSCFVTITFFLQGTMLTLFYFVTITQMFQYIPKT